MTEYTALAMAPRTSTTRSARLPIIPHRSITVRINITEVGESGALRLVLEGYEPLLMENVAIARTKPMRAVGEYEYIFGAPTTFDEFYYHNRFNVLLPRKPSICVEHEDGTPWTYEVTYLL